MYMSMRKSLCVGMYVSSLLALIVKLVPAQDFVHEDIPGVTPSPSTMDGEVGEGDERGGLREVDLVLSTTELWRLVEEHCQVGKDEGEGEGDGDTSADYLAAAYLRDLQPDTPLGNSSLESMLRTCSADGRSTVSAADANAGSGGYLEHLYRYAASRLHGVHLPPDQPLPYMQGRNADISEVLLLPPDAAAGTEPLLRFGKIYGFRNIQSLMLKMKRGKAVYDFVEIMACPSGCVNGGGQIKMVAQEHPAQTAERVASTTEYYHANMMVRDPAEGPLAQYLYGVGGMCSDGPCSETARRLFHTTYHAIPKLEVVAPLVSKW